MEQLNSSIVKRYMNIWTDERHYECDNRAKNNPNSKYELDKMISIIGGID